MASIVIEGVPKDFHDQLKNIAKNTGTTVTALVKVRLKDMVDNAPPESKREKPKH